jgi:hypothetical protein
MRQQSNTLQHSRSGKVINKNTHIKGTFMSTIEAYHNNTGNEHQDRYTTLAKEGFRPISLSCYGDPDEPLYAAVWEKRSGPAFKGRHGLSPNEYQSTFDTLAKQGFHPVIITATGDGGSGTRFAGVFEQNNIPTRTRFNMKEIVTGWGEPVENGFPFWDGRSKFEKFTLTWLSSYGGEDRDDRRYAAIWQELNPQVFYDAPLACDKNEYQSVFNNESKGLLPMGVAHPAIVTVNTAAPLYSSAWWSTNPWGHWYAFHNMSSSGYQNKFNDMKAAGFHPVRVQGGGGTGDDIRFAAIFAK